MSELTTNELPATTNQATEEQVQKPQTKFSRDDEAILINLWTDGATVKDIALAMGRTHTNIRNKVKALQDKGLIQPRERSNKVSEKQVQHLAGAFGIEPAWVEYFIKHFSGGADKIIAGVTECCMALTDQQGYCYYLSDRVKLSFDDSPSAAVPMYGHQNRVILVCKAIAHTRNTMSHEGFVNVCKYIAEKF